MPTTPLIPPHEAPPAAWRKPDRKFSWKLAGLGAAGGTIVGVIALLLGASPWWWLAVPVGLCVASISSWKSFDDIPALWARK